MREALAANANPVVQGRIVASRILPARSKVLQPAAATTSAEGKAVAGSGATVLSAAQLVTSVEAELKNWSKYLFKPFHTGHGGPTADRKVSTSFVVSTADFDTAYAQLQSGDYETADGKKIQGFHKGQSGSGGSAIWDIILAEDVNCASRNKMVYHIAIQAAAATAAAAKVAAPAAAVTAGSAAAVTTGSAAATTTTAAAATSTS
ncbi:MAG TPA: hypothetical protein VF789_07555 [Thermoanaerobaculia bacterium]